MEEMGITVEEYDDYVTVYRKAEKLSRINLKTLPYPGFPTDMGPQMCVLMCQAQGVSLLNEGIFSNRFRYVDELRRMGACIKVDDKTAIIEGGQPLSAANLRAVDLRAGAAVVLAALISSGRTEIEDIYHIERGYDNLVEKHSYCRATSFSRLQDLNHHCSTGLAKIFHAPKNYSTFNSLFYTRVAVSGQDQYQSLYCMYKY